MRARRLTASLLGAFVVAGPGVLRAQEVGASGQAAPLANPTPSPSAAPGSQGERRLALGTYRDPYDRSDIDAILKTPRFQSSVDVEAQAPPDFNATMAVWWQHFDFEQSVYGRGIAIQPTPRGGFNILPLVDWLAKKVKDSRNN
jgi:hypothetical protein